MQCPDCHEDLLEDPSNPEKMLCYSCKKRFDRKQLEFYYGDQFENIDMSDRKLRRRGDTDQMEPVRSPVGTEDNQPSFKETLATTFSIAPIIIGLASVILVWMPQFSSAAAILGLLAAVLGAIGISMHINNSAPAISVALGLFAMVVFGIMSLIRIPVEFIEQSGIGEDANMVYQDAKNTYNDVRNVYGEAKNTTSNVYHDAKNTYEDARNAYDGAKNAVEGVTEGTEQPPAPENPENQAFSWEEIKNMGQEGIEFLKQRSEEGRQFFGFNF